MRKTLRVVGVIAALALLVAPAVVGIVAEHKQRGLIDDANAAGSANVQLAAYDRGWFGARSTLVYPMTGPVARRLGQWLGDTSADYELIIESGIRHGPVAGMTSAGISVATAESRLSLRQGDRLVAIPGVVGSRLTAGGRLTMRYMSGPGELILGSTGTIQWSAADVRGEFPGSGRLNAHGEFSGLSAVSDATTIALGDLELTGNYHRTRHGFWAGRGQVTTPVMLVSVDGSSFSARDVELLSDQRLAADVTNYRLALAAGSVGGKDWNGVDAQLKLRIDGIDAQSYASVLKGGAGSPAITDLSGLQTLLTPGASITLETLNLPTAHGAVLADFGITLPDTDPETGAPAIAYLLTMEGQGRLEIPRPLAFALSRKDARFRDALNRLLRLRMLKPVAGNYTLEAAYGGGLLTINGFPVPLPFVAQ